MAYDATKLKDWQISEAAEENMPTPDEWREKLNLQREERLAYGRIAKPSTPYRVTSRIIRQAQDCLSENLDRKMALSEVACAVGMSRYHFLREFKRATGLSPHRFRTQRRLEQAKALIHRGMPFAQVALETGFVDQSHLTKKFKQFYGATPGQYLSMGRS